MPRDMAAARAAIEVRGGNPTDRSASMEKYTGEISDTDPLQKLPGEGANAYRVFTEYASLPMEGRSIAAFIQARGALPKEARKGPGTASTIKEYSHRFRWNERLAKWDAIQCKRDAIAAADENFDARKRRRLIANSTLKAAEMLLDGLVEAYEDPILRRLQRITVKDVAMFVKMATDLSRTEHSEEGIPTKRVVVDGDSGDLERASVHELAALLRRNIAQRVGEIVLDELEAREGAGEIVDVVPRQIEDA